MENKFRAWDIRNSKMVEDALILSQTGQLATVNETYFNSPFSFFDGCIWMQFINAQDKHKKDIYVGDILKTSQGNLIYFDNIVEYHIWAYRNSIDFILTETVGNVYTNPELVK